MHVLDGTQLLQQAQLLFEPCNEQNLHNNSTQTAQTLFSHTYPQAKADFSAAVAVYRISGLLHLRIVRLECQRQ
jgi:hypothetical protein